jgi:hypothetical protein
MYRQIAAETADDPSNIKTKGIIKCVHNKKRKTICPTHRVAS